MLSYNFKSNKVRVIFGDDDEPYFVVEDICEILKIPDGRLSDEDKITHKLNDEQEIIVTSEFGLYELIMNSVGEKEFKRWILRKILPVIRTTAQIQSYPSQEMIHVLAVQKEISFDEGYKESYLSFNATVKLSGVRKDVMKKALKNPTSGVYRIFYGTNIPPTQKTAKLIQQWESGWKKISDSTIAKIIEYYAFEAPESNDRAKDTFKTFAPIGIRNWVKEAVQYIEKEPTDTEPKEILASIDEKLSVIQQTVQELSQQFPVSEDREE